MASSQDVWLSSIDGKPAVQASKGFIQTLAGGHGWRAWLFPRLIVGSRTPPRSCHWAPLPALISIVCHSNSLLYRGGFCRPLLLFPLCRTVTVPKHNRTEATFQRAFSFRMMGCRMTGCKLKGTRRGDRWLRAFRPCCLLSLPSDVFL